MIEFVRDKMLPKKPELMQALARLCGHYNGGRTMTFKTTGVILHTGFSNKKPIRHMRTCTYHQYWFIRLCGRDDRVYFSAALAYADDQTLWDIVPGDQVEVRIQLGPQGTFHLGAIRCVRNGVTLNQFNWVESARSLEEIEDLIEQLPPPDTRQPVRPHAPTTYNLNAGWRLEVSSEEYLESVEGHFYLVLHDSGVEVARQEVTFRSILDITTEAKQYPMKYF